MDTKTVVEQRFDNDKRLRDLETQLKANEEQQREILKLLAKLQNVVEESQEKIQ